MKRIATALAVVSLVLLGGAGAARAGEDAAGNLDHLVCYKMKDPMMSPASFDLLARLQPEFSRAGCSLVLDRNDNEVNSEFCVPASKKNVVAPNHDAALAGAMLEDDYVCYKIECPANARPPQKVVSDQFGHRQVAFRRPTRICVPATKEPVMCGQTGTNNKGVAQCGGLCPAGNKCQVNKATNACGCAPVPCKGKPDDADVCGGTCASDLVCSAADDGSCACAPRGCGVDPATNQCGGPCANPDHVCSAAVGGGCECATPPPPSGGCGLDASSGECGGDCPDGLFCLPPTSGGFTCVCRNFGGFD